MLKHDASDDWKRFGTDDPYFGVLTDARYHGTKLDSEARNEFFGSGHVHVRQLLQVLNETVGDVPRGLALDFGCGVGRLAQALAASFDHVVGLDVAPGMLAEARRNALIDGIHNVEYFSSLEAGRLEPRSYDLVHSYIVLQHIPVTTGEAIIENLIECVREGGVGALHITIRPPNGAWRRAARNLIKRNKLSRAMANIALGRPWDSPAMEMNLYRTERIVELLAKCGIERFSCVYVDDWGWAGLYILFKRGTQSKSPWMNPVSVN